MDPLAQLMSTVCAEAFGSHSAICHPAEGVISAKARDEPHYVHNGIRDGVKAGIGNSRTICNDAEVLSLEAGKSQAHFPAWQGTDQSFVAARVEPTSVRERTNENIFEMNYR